MEVVFWVGEYYDDLYFVFVIVLLIFLVASIAVLLDESVNRE